MTAAGSAVRRRRVNPRGHASNLFFQRSKSLKGCCDWPPCSRRWSCSAKPRQSVQLPGHLPRVLGPWAALTISSKPANIPTLTPFVKGSALSFGVPEGAFSHHLGPFRMGSFLRRAVIMFWIPLTPKWIFSLQLFNKLGLRVSTKGQRRQINR